MRLILKRSQDKLGTIGDVVDVKAGFGRNYLIPQGIAVAVTPENVRAIDRDKQHVLLLESKQKEAMAALGAKLADRTVKLEMRAGEDGTLYGSVTPQIIAESLRKDDLEVEPKAIALDEPIKALGNYTVKVKLHKDVQVEIKVWVQREGGEASASVPPATA